MLNGLVMAPELHVRQLADGTLLAGTDFGGTNPGENPEQAAAELFGSMRKALKNGNALEMSHFTVGYRPTPTDGFPIVGPVDGMPGLTLAVTHSGVTLAPVLGRLLSEEILQGHHDPLLKPYRLDRFARQAA